MAHLAFVLFSHLHLCTSRFSGSYGCHRTISLHPSQLKLLSQFFFVHLFRVDVVCCLLLLRSVIFFWIRTRECTSHTYVTHKNVLGPFVNEIFVYVDNITAGVMSVDWLTRSMRVSVGATRVACLLYAPEHTHTHHTANKKRHKSYAWSNSMHISRNKHISCTDECNFALDVCVVCLLVLYRLGVNKTATNEINTVNWLSAKKRAKRMRTNDGNVPECQSKF